MRSLINSSWKLDKKTRIFLGILSSRSGFLSLHGWPSLGGSRPLVVIILKERSAAIEFFLCGGHEECVDHLLVNCYLACSFWKSLSSFYKPSTKPVNIKEALRKDMITGTLSIEAS